ncbi:hypothetical protein CEXT_523161 [Caerostris extrusa]|uniref:Uncharacterized protein n=1 Tax=Caerostris extrusa TaxID=172846 RepID=A0AAV4SIV5_CAEEX|nr:hypothetical protein CEXT_523161 [Caerostris extrusa]
MQNNLINQTGNLPPTSACKLQWWRGTEHEFVKETVDCPREQPCPLAVPLVHIESFLLPACSREEKHPQRISTSSRIVVHFARGYGCYFAEWKIGKEEKEKKAVLEQIRVEVHVPLLSSSCRPHIPSFPVQRRK